MAATWCSHCNGTRIEPRETSEYPPEPCSVCKPSHPYKRYLGDAVYADWDGQRLVLTTEDGVRATNTIVLEPEVYLALVQYGAEIAKWKVRV